MTAPAEPPAAGDQVDIVETTEDGRRKPGGMVIAGRVVGVTGWIIAVKHPGHRADPFYTDTGWRAFDGEKRWRLAPWLPAEESGR